MANISISDLPPIKAKLKQLYGLDSEAIVGGLSIIGDFCGGVKFVPGETFTLPNGGVGVRLKPVFIPCNPQPCNPQPTESFLS